MERKANEERAPLLIAITRMDLVIASHKLASETHFWWAHYSEDEFYLGPVFLIKILSFAH